MTLNNKFIPKKRRGLSSVVGALLFVVLMVATFAVLGVALNSQTDIVSTGRDVAEIGLEKQQEKFTVNSVFQPPSGFLQVNVKNNGQNPAEIFTLIITNSSDIAEGFPTTTYEIPSDTSFLSPNDDDSINIVETLDLRMAQAAPSEKDRYSFKIISSLGTIEKVNVECDETGLCGQSIGGGGTGNLAVQLFLDGPNGVNTKTSTVIMFVSNIGDVPLEDVWPDTACPDAANDFPSITHNPASPPAPPGLGDFTGCTIAPSPDATCGSPNNDGTGICLAVGQTALFKWDGVVEGDIGDVFLFCNSVSGEEEDDTLVGPSNVDCDTLTVIDPNDCGGCGPGGEGGATIILVDDLLTRPSLFMIIPSPFGEEADGGAVWGVNLVNPTEVNMTISKLTMVVYPPTANDADAIVKRDSGMTTCVLTEIFPTDGNWKCPKDNTILWQNQDSPIPLPRRSAVEMLVKVEPGAPAAGKDIDALIVQANVFTTLGSFGKGEGYQSTMRSGDTPLVNVLLQNAASPDRDDFHGTKTGITELTLTDLYVSLADMDNNDGTFIEDGAKLIINVPRQWTNVTLNTWSGFDDDTDLSPGDQRVVSLGDESTQITLITDIDIGGCEGGGCTPGPDIVTVTFEAQPPCNDIVGENQPYIMYVLADGKTGPVANSFPIGPLNEMALVVNYDSGLDRSTCDPPQ